MNKEHGYYAIEHIDDIVVITFVGTVNLSTAEKYAAELKAIVTAMNGAPFKILIEGSEFAGATPDAFEASNQLNEWLTANNMVAKAVVHQSEVHMKISRQHEPSINNQNLKEFANIEDAKHWLDLQ